jgi:AcrR family transcriptional regulator
MNDDRRRGRPRDPGVEEAVHNATLDRLVADGLGALSIEAVAAAAGVGKATIYRRWPNKEALIIDALSALQIEAPEPPGDSVRDDLVLLVDTIRRRNEEPRGVRILTCILSEAARHPEIAQRYRREIIEPRRELVRKVLRRGVQTGELRADLDVELALDLVIAPMLVATMLRPGPVPADFAARIVDAVLAGIAPDDEKKAASRRDRGAGVQLC